MSRLDLMKILADFDKRVANVERISWTILGMLLAKAGVDIAPLVSALLT